jgi:hypothetical protein
MSVLPAVDVNDATMVVYNVIADTESQSGPLSNRFGRDKSFHHLTS